MKNNPKQPPHKTVTLSILLILSLFNYSYNCPPKCHKCKTANTCLECKNGYGLVNSTCIQCSIQNCSNCDDNYSDCKECALYHFRVSEEGGSIHQCQACGFGCSKCETNKKCLNCSTMFTQDALQMHRCVIDAEKLFFMASSFFCSLSILICLAFYLSPGREKPKIKKIVRIVSRKSMNSLNSPRSGTSICGEIVIPKKKILESKTPNHRSKKNIKFPTFNSQAGDLQVRKHKKKNKKRGRGSSSKKIIVEDQISRSRLGDSIEVEVLDSPTLKHVKRKKEVQHNKSKHNVRDEELNRRGNEGVNHKPITLINLGPKTQGNRNVVRQKSYAQTPRARLYGGNSTPRSYSGFRKHRVERNQQKDVIAKPTEEHLNSSSSSSSSDSNSSSSSSSSNSKNPQNNESYFSSSSSSNSSSSSSSSSGESSEPFEIKFPEIQNGNQSKQTTDKNTIRAANNFGSLKQNKVS